MMSISELVPAALLMGVIGSLHCVGMCGPLALAIPMGHRGNWGRIAGGVLYNLGRVTTYILLGAVLGFAGQTFLSGRAQQVLSILLGIGILLYLLVPAVAERTPMLASVAGKPLLQLRRILAPLFHSKAYASPYIIGLLNGLLPCGLIYMAVTTSFLTGSVWSGSLFMALFGLGTFPAMLAVVFFGQYMKAGLRMQLRKAMPVFLVAMGTLLILRGLNLGIPYISPELPNMAQGGVSCH